MPGRAEAGRTGDDVRSDLHVTVELRKSGGRTVDVESKVAAYYSESITETIDGVLDALAVRHAQITVDDRGALPFVIAARVETALRRAGVTSAGDARPAGKGAPAASQRDRPRRSRLYLPGNEPKFFVNAGLHRPDAVILDLEDSVHPSEKDAARLVVRNALRCVDFGDAERMVRINQVPAGFDDLEAVVPEAPHVVLVPKAERTEDIRAVHERILDIQRRVGLDTPIWLMPILETALGVEHAFAIAMAADTVVALTVGLEDYTADLGATKTMEGSESLYARMRLVNAAKAARVQAIDSVFGDVGDEEGLAAWARRSRALGFEGMGCIHPRQIGPIHDAFAPSTEEIEKALRVVAAFDEAQAKGLSVVSLGTRMIDPPVVRRAQRVVAAARQAGLIADNGSAGGDA
jgi:citrate lyase subunit beta/citryl-CoA lyase